MYVISSEGGRPKRSDIDHLDGFSRDGTWIYFTSSRSGEDQIWKMPVKGGPAIQVTKSGGSEAVESPNARYLYYLKTGARGKISVWGLPTGGGDEALVLESVVNNNFAVTDRGIYFIPDAKPSSVQFKSFDTGNIVTIAGIAREPAYGFSVSPDGRTLLFTGYEPVRSDLMLVENFR